MTSLQFFRESEPSRRTPVEWGTGKHKEKIDISLPRNPTWRTSGEPVTQYYKLTQLKLSNVRDNDELVPKPQAFPVGQESINRPFPGEHPYTSHMPRYAVFPSSIRLKTPKRGVAARGERPISSEMPANPYDVTVMEKIKEGSTDCFRFPKRHEFQDFPHESERQALYWPGENFFDQQSKVHGNTQQFYPTPPKLVCPNLQDHSARSDLRLSPRTANALRNVERDQWQTTHKLHFTGLGPANPMKLDNLDDKQERLIRTGVEDDSLEPQTVNTFDPPRGKEGRLIRNVCPLPIHQKPLVSGTIYDSEYTGKPTLTEREEQRLLCGGEYLNLPDTTSDPSRDVSWRERDSTARAGPCLEKVEEAKQGMVGTEEGQTVAETPYPQATTPRSARESYMTLNKREQDRQIEQMEAQNRWQELQAQHPARDREALNIKMKMLHKKEKPATFYKHEGRYNEERAGMYKTSYDPHSLAWSMKSAESSGDHLTNTLHSNIESQFNVSLPAARLNEDVNAALKWSRTFNLSKPELSGDRREGPEVIQTYNQVKSAQRQQLLPPPPPPGPASPRVEEEGVLLQREATTMGSGYNVKKFLQENAIYPPRQVRNDPTCLMSTENQNLERVRMRSIPRLSKTCSSASQSA